ncbi:MAG: hypothetical protein EHM72_11205 [Calditrichaeota bacterium]|nr:MAG: hypothetical protein EHM72_11205 [Calditrichota bacterium]
MNKKRPHIFQILFSIALAVLLNCEKKISDSYSSPIQDFDARYSTTDSRLLVGTCYYPWYTKGQHWDSSYMRSRLNPLQTPYLGEYDCAASKVISQHVKWSVDSKIDFWISSWWGPGSIEDDVILRNQLHNSDFKKKMGYCLLYETVGRMNDIPVNVNFAKIFGHCEPKSGILAFDSLVSDVMNREPYASAKRVFWIVDNGSSHRGQKAIQRLQSKWPNIVLIHLPVHASWLNQIEIIFSILQRKILTPNDFASLSDLADTIIAFEKRYEKIAKPFEWKFTRDDLSKMMKKLSQSCLQYGKAA